MGRQRCLGVSTHFSSLASASLVRRLYRPAALVVSDVRFEVFVGDAGDELETVRCLTSEARGLEGRGVLEWFPCRIELRNWDHAIEFNGDAERG